MASYLSVAIGSQIVDLSVSDNGTVTIVSQHPMSEMEQMSAERDGHRFGLCPTPVNRVNEDRYVPRMAREVYP